MPLLIARLLCALFLAALPAWAVEGQAKRSVQDGFIKNAERLIYANQELGFIFEGPKGWAGLTQYEDASGKPAYPLPPAVRQIYKKQNSTGTFPSVIEIQIAGLEEGTTPIQLLRGELQQTPAEDVLTQPAEKTFGANVWAAAAIKEKSSRGQAVSKWYMRAHKKSVILITAISPAEEFDKDEPVFDAAVANAKFADGPALAQMLGEIAKTANPASITKPGRTP